jgi:hypothetical protein
MDGLNRSSIGCLLTVAVVTGLVLWSRSRCRDVLVAEQRDPAYPLTAGLYPLRHPMYCAREAAKHCALLEDHLADPHRRCNECCRKHMLMVEGFLEEGMLMDRHQKYQHILAPAIASTRRTVERFVRGEQPAVLAQQFREIRKPLSDAGFEYFQ